MTTKGIFATVPQEDDGSIYDGKPQVGTLESFTYDVNADQVPGVITYTYSQPDSNTVIIGAFVFVPFDTRRVYSSDLAVEDAREALRDKWNGKDIKFEHFKL